MSWYIYLCWTCVGFASGTFRQHNTFAFLKPTCWYLYAKKRSQLSSLRLCLSNLLHSAFRVAFWVHIQRNPNAKCNIEYHPNATLKALLHFALFQLRFLFFLRFSSGFDVGIQNACENTRKTREIPVKIKNKGST